jgi:hypothetical protein
MSAAPHPPQPRRQIWPWVVGIILTPFVVAGLAVVSVLRLNADAAHLRDELMSATGGGWHAKVQLTLDRPLLAAARTGIACLHDVPDEARQALRAVRSASVGVYERKDGRSRQPREPLWAAADRVMSRRGWTRVVGVSDTNDTVLIYVPTGRADAKPARVCLAVYNGHELVIVAGGFEADALADLVARETGGRLPFKL